MHKYLTTDGLAMVACHEIGHFLGGEPKKLRGRSNKKSWSSAEGQADYYAARCLEVYFSKGSETENREESALSERVINEARRVCYQAYVREWPWQVTVWRRSTPK